MEGEIWEREEQEVTGRGHKERGEAVNSEYRV